MIKSLDLIKAHGCENLSVKMIKVCTTMKNNFWAIIKRRKIWKKENVVPLHKKEEESLVKNHRSISLLYNFGKIFERLIYNSIFNYFIRNKLLTPSQPGFLTRDPCITQLLSLIHEIKIAFNKNPAVDVREIFLDASKAFDKVWHGGLSFKLKTYGVEDDPLPPLKNLQIVKKSCFKWWNIWVEKNQFWSSTSSLVGALLFFIYINDLPDGIASICKISADDTSLFSKVFGIAKSANGRNIDLEEINQWAYQWKMQFNPGPTKQANEVIFSHK